MASTLQAQEAARGPFFPVEKLRLFLTSVMLAELLLDSSKHSLAARKSHLGPLDQPRHPRPRLAKPFLEGLALKGKGGGGKSFNKTALRTRTKMCPYWRPFSTRPAFRKEP